MNRFDLLVKRLLNFVAKRPLGFLKFAAVLSCFLSIGMGVRDCENRKIERSEQARFDRILSKPAYVLASAIPTLERISKAKETEQENELARIEDEKRVQDALAATWANFDASKTGTTLERAEAFIVLQNSESISVKSLTDKFGEKRWEELKELSNAFAELGKPLDSLTEPTKPTYDGAVHIVGSIIGNDTNGIIVHAGENYYFIDGGQAVGNGWGNSIQGYVDDTSRTELITIGKRTKIAKVVTVSDQTSYDDDQSNFLTRQREYQKLLMTYRTEKSQRGFVEKKRLEDRNKIAAKIVAVLEIN